MKRRGPKGRHNWTLWLDGGRHVLRQGEDFDCTPRALMSRARSHGVYHGIKVRTRRLGDGKTVEIRRVNEEQIGGRG